MGAIQRVQRQPYAAYPQYLVRSGRRPYDETDALAADICSTIKRRGEDFESDEQLTSWLEEDGVVSLRLPWLWRCWTSSTAAGFDAPLSSTVRRMSRGPERCPQDLPSMIAKTPGRSRFSVRVPRR